MVKHWKQLTYFLKIQANYNCAVQYTYIVESPSKFVLVTIYIHVKNYRQNDRLKIFYRLARA